MVLEATEHCQKLDLQSEFVAMRIATEMLLALRTSLWMLGVPLDGPAEVFCDNNSVVQSSTIPASVLKKKHNVVSFHKVRETIAVGGDAHIP